MDEQTRIHSYIDGAPAPDPAATVFDDIEPATGRRLAVVEQAQEDKILKTPRFIILVELVVSEQ